MKSRGMSQDCGATLDPTASLRTQLDSPFVLHEARNNTETRSAICPLQHLFRPGRIGAEPIRMRNNPDSPKVQAVGVPAGLNRDVGMGSFVRVAGTGSMKEPELVVGQVDQTSPKVGGKLGGTRAMIRVGAFVEPL